MQRAMACLAALLAMQVVRANVYTVDNANDDGAGSLREAIEDANAHAGADRIEFDAAMNGEVISPLSPLPALTDDGTVIFGSLDADAAPDVMLDGELLAEGNGLSIGGDACEVRSLAIVRFPSAGVVIGGCSNCTIQGCHIGLNLGGTAAWPNRNAGIAVYDADQNTIGGTSARTRNIIATGLESSDCGIWILYGNDNIVTGNYIGLRRSGSAAVGAGKCGIIVTGSDVTPSTGNRIGGTDAGAGNLFGGLEAGMKLQGATDTTVTGNVFGLAADGDTLVPIDSLCIFLWGGTTGSHIGGTTAEARNVFAGAHIGVDIFGAGTEANRVQGNYFGTNVAGTEERSLSYALKIRGGAGPQTVGGATDDAGNVFTPSTLNSTGVGIDISGPSATLVQNNTFGILPNGTHTTGMSDALSLTNSVARVDENLITWAGRAGVSVTGADADPAVFRNRLRHCDRAVWIQDDAHCRLGNLGNANAADNGGNVFRWSDRADIWNDTGNRVRAEGNNFGTIDRAEIEDRIVDRRDDPTLGRVDFDPLQGGIIPTGGTVSLLALTGLAVAPGPGGAEVIFSLSAPAVVDARILSIAGRPVRTLCLARDCEAGPHRLLWNAQSDAGLSVPNGLYLVEVTARAADVSQARALTQLRTSR